MIKTCDGCRAYQYNYFLHTCSCLLNYPINVTYKKGYSGIPICKPKIKCPKPRTWKQFDDTMPYK